VRELRLEIAGVGTVLATADADVVTAVRDRYKGFLAGGTVDWRFTVEARPGAPLGGEDVLVAASGHPRRLTAARHDFAASLDLDRRHGEVVLGEADDIALDAFLRTAYSLILLDRGGLVLHASSLARLGRGHVFCGRSGAGKTTVARLSTDAALLSDELSIVTVREGAVRCHGTPFWGELARGGENQAVPLTGLYFLHQGADHALRPLGRRQVVERLLPNVLFFGREPALTSRVLAIAADLADAVAGFDLTFRRDPGFWTVIDHA
jgi:hypothetical protein